MAWFKSSKPKSEPKELVSLDAKASASYPDPWLYENWDLCECGAPQMIIGKCKDCGRHVCEDCSVQHQTSRRNIILICRSCALCY